MTNQPAPLFDPEHGPVTGADFVAIYADDRLLDDVGSGRHHKRSDPFADMLARMRAAAGDEPYPQLVDTDTAKAAIAAGHRHRAEEIAALRPGPGVLVWVVVALAVAVGLTLIVWFG